MEEMATGMLYHSNLFWLDTFQSWRCKVRWCLQPFIVVYRSICIFDATEKAAAFRSIFLIPFVAADCCQRCKANTLFHLETSPAQDLNHGSSGHKALWHVELSWAMIWQYLTKQKTDLTAAHVNQISTAFHCNVNQCHKLHCQFGSCTTLHYGCW